MNKKILILEPDEDYADPEKEILKQNGYSVLVVDTVKKAITVLRKEKVDGVLMEVNIPGENALDGCREMRLLQNVPIIIITSERDEASVVSAFEAGAEDYIQKPFFAGELLCRLKSRIDCYEKIYSDVKVDSDHIIEGDLKIDKVERRVFIRGEEKSFTLKEYELLLYLAEHPGRVFTKEELFRTIWGMESVGGDIATVTVHIKKIRGKIEKKPSEPEYIETIWSTGYRFRNVNKNSV